MVALERYRLANGEYPSDLDQLVPRFLASIPLDPWSGLTMRYRKGVVPATQPAGYLLYSIGTDMTDDGGTNGGAQALTTWTYNYDPVKRVYLPAVTPGDYIFNTDVDVSGSDRNW